MAPVVAERRGHLVVGAWLDETHRWKTALHHLDVLTYERALRLLRAGGDIYAAEHEEIAEDLVAEEEGQYGPWRVHFGPSPLSLAQAAAAAGGAAAGTPAFLVLEAAKPWSCQTHCLFPPAARARGSMLKSPRRPQNAASVGGYCVCVCRCCSSAFPCRAAAC